MNKKYYKSFQIDCAPYMYSVQFIITRDIARAARQINNVFDIKQDAIDRVVDADFDCKGKIFTHTGYIPIIWMPEKPVTPTERGTLSHEIFHAVCKLSYWCGLKLGPDSEEAWCHLIGYLTRTFYDKIK